MSEQQAAPEPGVGLPPGSYWALFYEYVDDMATRRDPVRPAHLELITQFRESGELVNAGAVGNPPSGGLLVFAADARAAVDRFVAEDPYGQAGLIVEHRVEPWNVV